MSAKLVDLLTSQPFRVLDVGARWDIAVHFRPFAAHTEVVGFEPEPDECARLNAQLASQSGWA